MRPPGPDLRALGAALPTIRRFAPDYLVRVAESFPDAPLIAFPVPGRAVFLAATPQAARDVLVTGARDWSKDTVQYRSLARLAGSGLLTADGASWATSRQLLAPAFRAGGLGEIANRTDVAIDRFLADHLDRGPVDVEPGLLLASFAVLSEGLFGVAMHRDAQRLVEAVLAGLDVVVDDVQWPLPTLLRTARDARLARANAALDDAAQGLLAAWRADPVGDPTRHPLALLATAQDQGRLSARQVRDELVTMVIAGHETVASALVWTLWLLANHPNVQQRLRDSAIDDAFVAAVVDEALRLYPPAWVLSRTATRPTTVAGTSVPAGALAIVSPWQLHRRRQDWGENAERFVPERFLIDDATPRPGSYLPFGAGPRQCIGRELSLIQLRRAVFRICQAATVHSNRNTRPRALVTVRPAGGMRLDLRSR